jgi:prepilin-type N-terminal cleavage/methylation domain-containing protein
MAEPLLEYRTMTHHCTAHEAAPGSLSRGFSLIELLIVVGLASTLMAVSLPILADVSEASKLNEAVRGVERELQGARLRAVNLNRPLRVRVNCPATGSFRTVEVIGTAADSAANRCAEAAFPYPAPDADLMTRPNYDGPLLLLPAGATATSSILQFEPNGTAFEVVAGAAQIIATPVTIVVTRRGKSKSVTVNGAGKIKAQ